MSGNDGAQYRCSLCTRPEFNYMGSTAGRIGWCKLHNAARVLRHASVNLRLAYRGLPRPLTSDASLLVDRLVRQGKIFDGAARALDEWLDTDPERTFP